MERQGYKSSSPILPPSLPREQRETPGLEFPLPKAKNDSCQLGRDIEVRSASNPLGPGVPQGCTRAPALSQDVHGCGAPGTSAGQCNGRGHLFAWVILNGRKDPFFYQLSTSQEMRSSPSSYWGTLPPPARPTTLCSSVQC